MPEHIIPKIIRNAVRCKRCMKYLESCSVHDFQQCKCGVFVDGGLSYMRRGWPDGNCDDWYDELSITREE